MAQWMIFSLCHIILTAAADVTNKYEEKIQEATADEKTEKAILKQEKVMTSGARFDATETCAGTFSTKLSDAYLTQPFYMNYETKFGGKEQYNDVIAQFNILQEKAYPSVENELGNATADL